MAPRTPDSAPAGVRPSRAGCTATASRHRTNVRTLGGLKRGAASEMTVMSSVRLRSWEEPALSRQHPAAVIGLHMGGAGDGCDPEGMTVVGEVGVSLLAI